MISKSNDFYQEKCVFCIRLIYFQRTTCHSGNFSRAKSQKIPMVFNLRLDESCSHFNNYSADGVCTTYFEFLFETRNSWELLVQERYDRLSNPIYAKNIPVFFISLWFSDSAAVVAYFYGPIAVLLLANVFMFAYTSFKIIQAQMGISSIIKNRTAEKERYLTLYFDL